MRSRVYQSPDGPLDSYNTRAGGFRPGFFYTFNAGSVDFEYTELGVECVRDTVVFLGIGSTGKAQSST